MAILLHIESSPRKDRSASKAVADAFVEAYRQHHPDGMVDSLDVWSADLPDFDGDTINAKYRILHGQAHSAEEAEAWKAVVAVADRLRSADKIVLSIPMWNFGIPYRLKHFLDVVIQPGLTFSFSPETGYRGLVTHAKAVIIASRGGAYDGDMASYDQQLPYIRQVLGFMGITDQTEIVIQPTLSGPDDVARVKDAAIKDARRLAATF